MIKLKVYVFTNQLKKDEAMFCLFEKHLNKFSKLSKQNIFIIILSKLLFGFGAGMLLIHYVPKTPIYIAWTIILTSVLISLPTACKMHKTCKIWKK